MAAGLAEGGETGIAYSLFLLLPDLLIYTTSLWIAILFITVVARSVLAHRVLRRDLVEVPLSGSGESTAPRIEGSVQQM
jgi:hypothetical protein